MRRSAAPDGVRYPFEERAEDLRVQELMNGIHDEAVGDIMTDTVNVISISAAGYAALVAAASLSTCPAWACAPAAAAAQDGLHYSLVALPAAPVQWAVCGALDPAHGALIVCAATVALPLAALAFFAQRLWRSVEVFPLRFEKKM